MSEVAEQINSGALSIENLMNGGSNDLSTLRMSRSVSGFVADLLSPTEEQQQNIPQVAADCLTVTNWLFELFMDLISSAEITTQNIFLQLDDLSNRTFQFNNYDHLYKTSSFTIPQF